MNAIRFYCGVNENNWNHHPVAPGAYSCIAPKYGKTIRTARENRVKVPKSTFVLQDSGAFSDGPQSRLSFATALDRQLQHSDKYGYTTQITHRASYDLLIDEVWTDGNRSKRRWTEGTANAAVEETVNAARYMRDHYDGACVLSAQGVTAQQYLECVKRVVPILDNSRDILGLGGWCIIGKLPGVMMPVFRETLRMVIPYIAKRGVKHVHVWGVIHAPALAGLLHTCDDYGISVSTDSAGPQLRPCFGSWGYAGWTDLTYKRPPVEVRGLERARHVVAVRDWLSHFRETSFYKSLTMPCIEYRQLSMFEVA